jgi:hypothetical protein
MQSQAPCTPATCRCRDERITLHLDYIIRKHDPRDLPREMQETRMFIGFVAGAANRTRTCDPVITNNVSRAKGWPMPKIRDRDYYLRLRREYQPRNIKLVMVAAHLRPRGNISTIQQDRLKSRYLQL